MKKLLTISLTVFLSSCVTTKDGDDGISDRNRERIPHAGGQMTTFLGQSSLERVINSAELQDVSKIDNADERKKIEDANLSQVEEEFLSSAGLEETELSGHARLIFDGLGSILEERRLGEVPLEVPESTHKECREAYLEKAQWHLANNKKIPAVFGKITEYVLTPVANGSYWVGAIDLCTWVGRTLITISI